MLDLDAWGSVTRISDNVIKTLTSIIHRDVRVHKMLYSLHKLIQRTSVQIVTIM